MSVSETATDSQPLSEIHTPASTMRTTTYEVPDVNYEQTPENYEQLSTTTPTTGHEQGYVNVNRTSNVNAYEALGEDPRASHTYERV